MPNTIGSLVIDLVANTASFATQLNSAVKSVEETASKIKAAFGGLGAIFSIAGIAELTKDTLEYGEQLEKAAMKTGLGANAISELAFAAKQANIDLPELTSSFTKMEKSISLAATGTGVSKGAFDALGISLDTIKSLSPEQQFELIANQISKLKDPTDKARAAIEIFGRAGADLLPLFNQGAAGIEAARQKAIDFGASLDSDQLKKLADASQAVKDLGASFSALATALVSKVAPAIAGFFDSITNLVTGNKAALLTKQIAELQERLDYVQASPGGGGPIAAQLQAEITKAELALQGVKLAKQLSDGLAAGSSLPDNKPPGFVEDPLQPIAINPNLKIRIDAMKKFYQDLDDATRSGGEKLLDDTAKLQAQVQVLLDDGQITLGDSFRRLNAGDDAKAQADLMAQNAAAISAAWKQTGEDIKESLVADSAESRLAAANMKADFEETANNARNAAQSMQDSFATFLVDPFSGGLKKMLQAWVQTIDQMVAKAAAQQIFKSLFGGTLGGLGGILQAFLSGGSSRGGGGSAPSVDSSQWMHYATGGSFKVGGNGGTDSQLVQFRASPDETVTVTTPGQTASGAGVTFAPVYHFGNNVSRAEVVQACKATQSATIAHVTMLITGGAFA